MAITDKIMKASSGTRPNPSTLTAQKGIGDAILYAEDLTGWATDTPVTFVLYNINASNVEIINTRSDWKGIVSGNSITQLTLTAGTDNIYPIGSPVIAAATARWADDLTTALLTSFEQTGALKASVVTPAMRSGGYKIGTISGATLGTTGNKAITGLGFTPKMVEFQVLATTGVSPQNDGSGAMVPGAQFYKVNFSDTGRFSGTDAAIAYAANASALALKASYVSMDAGGFTINVSIAASSFPVAYKAYA